MSEIVNAQNQREHLNRLRRLIADRALDYDRIESGFRDRFADEASEFSEAESKLTAQYELERGAVEEEYNAIRNEVNTEYDRTSDEVQLEFDRVLNDLKQQHTRENETAAQQHEEARWMVASVFDEESEDSPKQRYELFKGRLLKEKDFLETQKAELDGLLQQAHETLEHRRQSCDDPLPSSQLSATAIDELRESHTGAMDAARDQLHRLRGLWLSRQFSGIRPLFVFLVVFAVVLPLSVAGNAAASGANPLDTLADPAGMDRDMAMMSGVIAAVVAMVICLFMYLSARGRAFDVFHRMQQDYSDADTAHRRWLKKSKEELRRQRLESEKWYAELVARRDAALKQADDTLQRRREESAKTRTCGEKDAHRRYPDQLGRLMKKRDDRLAEADGRFPPQLRAMQSRYESRLGLIRESHEKRVAELNSEYRRQWDEMSANWHNGFRMFRDFSEALAIDCRERFQPWIEMAESDWHPPSAPPEFIQIGEFTVDLASVENGIPEDESLEVTPTCFNHPALLAFPEEASLTLEAEGDGRAAAVSIMQSAMLRMLTTIPPGKIRFTIVDPVGLGENFSAFMHLADYDELLVNNRIWTEAVQIDKRLSELTEHMENVFQTYLRNEFTTIQDYNRQAGEVAEPYHILVVANFPAGFSDEAVRRLISIAGSGPRCGVHTMISIDMKLPLPHGCDVRDLQSGVTNLTWQRDRFIWENPDLESLPFALEQPPGPDEFSRIVRAVGEQSRDARHVEVPFDRIAPTAERIWSRDTRHGVDVPLGRAGATKLQFMRLGKGTSQHVLIAGKTGSGKSTLLHILITNLSLYYGPDEIEFYLIDFKKGVEFKTYAANRLPHARVIAIESDREFGLSVLERLDEILRERGDLFREHGVQDLAGFRNASPSAVMPRIMLMIDEFQEFFVDDDQTAQRASLLLDRLVRQGRAFGIHVLLGSQTLGGAYSLARSTLGQVAVRIALQCSESDAHLILSEDNMAARLLSRPGEAIYNDANGLVEGNHPFQIAWLGDDRRDGWLSRIREQIDTNGKPILPPVVFEGNIPARPEQNAELSKIFSAGDAAAAPNAVKLWLGEPVSIKEPTKAILRRQAGHNILVVGQNDQLARGVLGLSLLSLAGQLVPAGDSLPESLAQFVVLDVDADPRGNHPEPWQQLADILPHRIQVIGPRDVASVITRLREEVSRRDSSGILDAPPVCLLIHNISRFRDLRRDEDDFGLGGFDHDKPAGPGKAFAEILREGPALGIQSIVWSDTFNNATRWMSNQSMREFEIRIAFQMNATDSANLIDTPAASRLGVNRALLYREESGTSEKFRPYGPPPAEWLQTIGDGLSIHKPVEATVDDLEGWTVL